jgi:RHS repeat-associated protein
LTAIDLAPIRGTWLGHTRHFATTMTTDYDGPNGYNIIWDPYCGCYKEYDEFAIIFDPNQPLWFDWDSVNSKWVPRHGRNQIKLEFDDQADVFTCYLPEPKPTSTGKGHKYVFHDFTTATPGRLKSYTAPDGVSVDVTYSSGRMAEQLRSYSSGGTTTDESVLYSYIASGTNAGKISTVTQRRKIGAGSWVNIRQATYTYHDGSDAHGNAHDLRTATVQEPNGAGGWNDIDISYYRYYKTGSNYVHGLKYALAREGYRRMVNAGLNPLTATDTQLAPYAEHYFEYDTSKRVTKEVAAAGCGSCSGGAPGTSGDTFAYSTSSNADGYNSWKYKTTVTHPDGNKTVVFTNYAAQPILTVFEQTGTSNKWRTFYKYDSEGHRVWAALPSAVTGHDETKADLLNSVSGNYQYLADSTGVIEVTDYYSTTDSQTGAVKGYVSYDKIKQGETGSEIKLKKYEYESHTDQGTGLSAYPIKNEIVYPSDTDQSLTLTTGYEYTWHSGHPRISQRTTTLPAVPTGQNGSGTSASRIDVYDVFGNLTWTKDERGYITRQVYDATKGVMSQRIQDVNTTVTTDEPSGWTTPTGGGSHLVSDNEYDDEGRITQVLGPSHEAIVSGTATTLRTATWTVYKETAKPASGTWYANQTWKAQGYATGTSPNYTYALVDPVTDTRTDEAGRTVNLIVSKRSTGSGRLSASDTLAQSDWKRWTNTGYNDKGQKTYVRVYHTIPSSGSGSSGTNYDQTDFAYDTMGRLNRTKSPGGTIARTLYDARGNVASIWIGTDDTGATASDPDGSGAPNNMVKVRESEWDDGSAGGDGLLTSSTRYEDGSNTRVTDYAYDWRRRLTGIDGEESAYLGAIYDNLDRPTTIERRNGTGTGTLLAKAERSYDSQGRVYRVNQYAVNSSGTPGNALTGNLWYDPKGNLLKAIAPGDGKAFVKLSYDGLGEITAAYEAFDLDETDYDYADDIEGDTVVAQVEAAYDDAGSLLSTTYRDRLHDATGTSTGALSTPGGTQPRARVMHSAAWYDAIGRTIAAAAYGTNEDDEGEYQSFTRPDSVPSASDTVLVSTVTYNDAGEANAATDPKGIETRAFRDHGGRLTQLIEAYQNGNATDGDADRDRVTEYAYNADWLLTELKAKQRSSNDDQVTKYIYGTTLSESGLAASVLLRGVIYPDSDDTYSAGSFSNGTDSTYDHVELKYDRLGEPTEHKDQNGTVHAYVYDNLGRLLHDRVTAFGTDIDQAAKRISLAFTNKGQLDKVSSYDNATVGSGNVLNEVKREYNDFGQLVREFQEHAGAVNTGSSANAQYGYASGASGSNVVRRTGITYPSGRAIAYEYGSADGIDDVLSRIVDLKEGSTALASYTRMGGGWPVRVDMPEPDLRLDLWGGASGTYAGLDRFNRLKDQHWLNSGTSTDLDQFQYAYDRSSSGISRDNTLTSGLDELYAYDSLDRLAAMDRGTISGGAIASPVKEQDWSLDPLGNWLGFLTKASGTTDLDQSRTHSKANEIASISETTGPAWADPVHDRAGNMTTIPKPADMTGGYTGVYDAWDRLVEVKEGSSTVATYEYDGQARRVSKTVSGTTTDAYYTAGWQMIEERVGGNVVRQYVWGVRYVDELVCRDADTDANGSLDQKLYAVHDANWNVTAIVDSSGAVVERYAYTPYGERTIMTPGWAARGSSLYAWTAGHQALMLDGETGLYANRYRYLHPLLGRFTSRDPIGYVGGSMGLYEYVGSAPTRFGDPSGLDRIEVDPLGHVYYYDETVFGLVDYAYVYLGRLHGGNNVVDMGGGRYTTLLQIQEASDEWGTDWDTFRDTQTFRATGSETAKLPCLGFRGVAVAQEQALAEQLGEEPDLTDAVVGTQLAADAAETAIYNYVGGGPQIATAAMSPAALAAMKLKGVGAVDDLARMTHADLVRVFEGTGLKLSGHAIKRLKDPRLRSFGIKTPRDILGILRHGRHVKQADGTVAIVRNGVAVIVSSPSGGTIITITPY